MAKEKKPAMPPIAPPEKKDYGKTLRVSSELHRMVKWISILEEGEPSTQSIMDWAAFDRILARFKPLEAAAMRQEAAERETRERLEKEREELRKQKPG